jgi:hypothetical protein
VDLLDAIDELLRRTLAENAPLPAPIEYKRKRGRPVTTPELMRPIRDMSPRQLARNDLIETAFNFHAVVAKGRADSLNLGRTERSKAARTSSTTNERADRVKAIASILGNPTNSAWASHPNSKLALRDEFKKFAAVNSETLRKGIAKAKKTKLARHT